MGRMHVMVLMGSGGAVQPQAGVRGGERRGEGRYAMEPMEAWRHGSMEPTAGVHAREGSLTSPGRAELVVAARRTAGVVLLLRVRVGYVVAFCWCRFCNSAMLPLRD